MYRLFKIFILCLAATSFNLLPVSNLDARGGGHGGGGHGGGGHGGHGGHFGGGHRGGRGMHGGRHGFRGRHGLHGRNHFRGRHNFRRFNNRFLSPWWGYGYGSPWWWYGDYPWYGYSWWPDQFYGDYNYPSYDYNYPSYDYNYPAYMDGQGQGPVYNTYYYGFPSPNINMGIPEPGDLNDYPIPDGYEYSYPANSPY
jgi:hypothetical protein